MEFVYKFLDFYKISKTVAYFCTYVSCEYMYDSQYTIIAKFIADIKKNVVHLPLRHKRCNLVHCKRVDLMNGMNGEKRLNATKPGINKQ